MIDALPLLLGPEGYQISRSVRLRSSASAYFNRTPASATNQKTWTWSSWIKRGSLSSQQTILSGGNVNNDYSEITFLVADTLVFSTYDAGVQVSRKETAQVFRDVSAWYHIVVAYDSTDATAGNRVKLYVNGVQVTVFAGTNTNPALNQLADGINGTAAMNIGRRQSGADRYLDGYLTEVNFIDGQALTPASFGETNPVTGVWQPKKYAGTYGTNGFYLNFSDNSAATAAAIGADYSGNGNNWTPNNISVTAGVTYDSMLDVPTLWADGGNGRGNYAVLNPLDSSSASNTISGGNLNATITSNASLRGSIYVSTGKWYYEVTVNTLNNLYLGLASNAGRPTGYTQTSAFGVNNVGDIYEGNTIQTEDSIALAAGSTYGIAFDADAKRFWIAKDGQWYSCDRTPDITISASDVEAGTYGYDFSSLTGDAFAPHFGNSTTAGAAVSANFGQRPFAFSPPTGFKALNTLNLPQPTILKGNQYFDATTYTGNGGALTVTNSGGMQPDLLWTKQRSGTAWNYLQDSVRGVNKALFSNATDAEYSITPTTTTLNSNGFSFNGAESGLNVNAATYVGWQWKEGPTQGFDIVTYTGTGVARTIAHSLGVKPSMIIIKNRSGAYDWPTWHQFLPNPTTQHFWLNATNAAQTSGSFNSTQPTSNVFSVGTTSEANANGNNFVAYLFSEVAGFSKAFSYTGNGSADGTFVFCGFRPRFVMVKRTDAVDNWAIFDTSRLGYNADNNELQANTSSAEGTADFIDILSNGFKNRNSDSRCNASGGTYIGFAWAEVPFKNSLAR